MTSEAVFVTYEYGLPDLAALNDLEQRLQKALAEKALGVCAGHDITRDFRQAKVYLYGEDAEAMLTTVQPVFEQATCVRNAVATLRFGPPHVGSRERVVRISGAPDLAGTSSVKAG